MSEKLVLDAAVRASRSAERRLETLVKKAWSIMDAASEKKRPSEYLGDRARRSIQGRVTHA
jgi:hypothetical protein